MKKRIVCVLLTLIMLVGMLPLSAAAAGQTTSERAITVLKQMQTYNKYCTKYGTEWRNGYGTICTLKGDHEGADRHSISEAEADKALRKKLVEVEAAVNAAGFSLSQNKFDALVVLTYDVGTSWLSGTGVLKSAVKNGLTGNAFLNAIGQTSGYNSGTTWKLSEKDRRMVEANMYLNGAYSNVPPSNYSYVTYDANGGTMAEGTNGQYIQYFDKTLSAVPAPVPTLKNKIFLGWYQIENGQYVWVPYLSTFQGERHLVAQWQDPGISYTAAKDVYDWQDISILTSAYIYDNPKNANIIGYHSDSRVLLDKDYIDANGNRWGRLKNGAGWVLVSGKASGSKFEIDVTVTVTNSTLNRRVNASVTSSTNGSYKKGDQLRIITTDMGSGLLWGQVADENGTALGWVALRYTNWNEVKDNPAASNTNNDTKSDIVATAVVNCAGYLNVRSEAGTDNAIVGALADGDHVDIYEIKFVNGHQWGRTTEGWILLTYAKVEMKNKLDLTTAADVLAYTFTGTLKTNTTAHTAAAHNAELVGKEVAAGTLVAVSMVKNDESGKVWGFNGTGWISLDNVIMDVAKYVVVSDSVSVRNEPASSSNTVEKVVKGVELDISEIAVVDASIWGKTEKYGGWVNLASKYVQRSNAPVIENVESNKYNTGLIATVINTGSVNVRTTGTATSAKKGSLTNGTTVNVWEANEACTWYKVDSNRNGEYDYEADGWVSAKYLDVRYGTIGGDETTNGTANNSNGAATTAPVETGLGVVANTYTGVNIRQGAGTGFATNGKYLTGTAVEILEVTSTATSKWGRTEKGWVCMDYITMVSKYAIGGTAEPSTPATDPNAGQNTGGSSSKTEGNTTISSTPAVYAGVVIGNDVPVLKTADEDAISIATLTNGQNITIQELVQVKSEITVAVGDVVDGNANTQTFEKTITTTYWARVNGGWVKDPAANLKLNTLDERAYTVVDYAEVNVRDSANGNIIADIDKGTQVAITNLEIVNDKVWGYAEDLGNGGWIRLDTMAEGAITINTAPTETTPAPTQPTITMGNGSDVGGYVNNDGGYRYTGKVINTDAVNVRTLPTTNSNAVIQLKYGQNLVIYETTIADGMAWGRCDAGWVYLYYVDLTPVVNGAVDARVVYNENTIIYTDVNCSAVAGTYAKMSVIDIYEIVGTMARTDKGWVSTNDLL